MKPRPTLVTAATLLAVAVASTPVLDPADAARASKAAVSKVTITAEGTTVTIRGRVALPQNTAAARKRTRVALTLTDAAGKVERFRAKIDGKRLFTVTHTTALTGPLTLAAGVTIGGKASGKRLKRAVEVAGAPDGTPLVGTFKLDPGSAPSEGRPTGTYFQMLTSRGVPLQNASSPSPNKNITPLAPGTDGGLRTDAYQEPPSPAFSGGTSGHALAGKIVKPTPFFGTNFSIVTAPTDPQAGVADPLPEIKAKDGKLTGQITAWAAQWNGQSFNQGTPKPDGTTPPPTSQLSGTYDAATRKFTLDWRSLIISGPFDGFSGVWHLEGTFVPVARRS